MIAYKTKRKRNAAKTTWYGSKLSLSDTLRNVARQTSCEENVGKEWNVIFKVHIYLTGGTSNSR